jgi:hypothetical protein
VIQYEIHATGLTGWPNNLKVCPSTSQALGRLRLRVPLCAHWQAQALARSPPWLARLLALFLLLSVPDSELRVRILALSL